jgi:hypothetical protein
MPSGPGVVEQEPKFESTRTTSPAAVHSSAQQTNADHTVNWLFGAERRVESSGAAADCQLLKHYIPFTTCVAVKPCTALCRQGFVALEPQKLLNPHALGADEDAQNVTGNESVTAWAATRP